MAKLLVLDEERAAKVPFLRGMLTSSLQDAGLSFTDAYRLSTDIRDDFEDAEVVTTGDLRERITEALREEYPAVVVRRYQSEDIYPQHVQVVYGDGHSAPFSRGILAQRLESCSLPRGKREAVARMIHNKLMRDPGRWQITTDQLTALTATTIAKELGRQHADHYLIWNDFIDNDQPLLVLIGGVPGTGKSTVATGLANRIGVVRTQSTDMLREVMRILIPKRVSPQLHVSSFDAGRATRRAGMMPSKADEPLLYGYQRQTELVEAACEAVLRRALGERVSMILEGVHIRPSLLQRVPRGEAVIVPLTLCLLDKESLISRIKGRRVKTRARRAARYLQRIDDIWQLQSALLSEADRADIQIINNVDSERTVSEIIRTITQTIAATYDKGRIRALRARYR